MILEDEAEANHELLWRLFSIKADCEMCHQSVTLEQGSFTALWSHLEACHGINVGGVVTVEDQADCDFNQDFKEEDFKGLEGEPSKLVLKPIVISIKKSVQNGLFEEKDNRTVEGISNKKRRRGVPMKFEWNIWEHWDNDHSLDQSMCKHCGKVKIGNPKDSVFTNKLRQHTEVIHIDQLSEQHRNSLLQRNRKDIKLTRKKKLQEYFSEANNGSDPADMRCNICQQIVIRGAATTYRRKLVAHMRRSHGLFKHRIAKHLCPHCGKEFDNPDSLRSHLLIHIKSHPIHCPYEGCGKGFLSKNSKYDCHIRSHTGEKPFMCNECGKRFAGKSILNNHHRNVHGVWMFSCNVCQKRLQSKHNLIEHMRSHTGEKPFECQECGKKFSTKSTLITHYRIHTGEMPYQCKKCLQRFKYVGSKTAHKCDYD